MGKSKVWYEKTAPGGSITLNGNFKATQVSPSGSSRRKGKVSAGGTFQ